MPLTKKIGKQLPVYLEEETRIWAEQTSEKYELSIAHVLRNALRQGARILDYAGNTHLLDDERPYSRHDPGYAGTTTLLLAAEDAEWLAYMHEKTGHTRATIIRVAIRVGRTIIDRQCEAADQQAA